VVVTAPYTPAAVWTPPASGSGGKFSKINSHESGAREEKELPVGKHPIQLYSLGTPNGVKVTVLLEELVECLPSFEYDAWLLKIDGEISFYLFLFFHFRVRLLLRLLLPIICNFVSCFIARDLGAAIPNSRHSKNRLV
jgi:hypothetical protein